jgi:hypothetical protein
MKFDLAEYIRQAPQIRDSGKRDIFEKDYFHPLHDTTYKVCITIFYDSGYSKFNSPSIWLMTIELISLSDEKTLIVFNGIAPTTFDQAADLLELSLPTVEYLQKRDLNG